MNNSPISNVSQLKLNNNSKEVLEAALREVDDMIGVVVIKIDKNHNCGVLLSDLSGYQVAYTKAIFNGITDSMLTGSVTKQPLV